MVLYIYFYLKGNMVKAGKERRLDLLGCFLVVVLIKIKRGKIYITYNESFNSVAVSTILCHVQLVPKHNCLLEQNFVSIRQLLPDPFFSQLFRIPGPLPVSVDLPILGTSIQWDCTLCGLRIWLISLYMVFPRFTRVVA